MLNRIYCSEFLESNKTVFFHSGLNAVLGDSDSSNSIGKSTMLMIIDFCFGGDDYILKEKNTIEHVGNHSICFEFSFNNKRFYFSRSTISHNEVIEYIDENFTTPKSKHTITGFRQWLLNCYHLNDTDLTFRAAVSRFFRIYNRNTHNETRPLNSALREDDKTGIEFLMKIYKMYGNLDTLINSQEEIATKNKVYENLRKYNIGSISKDQNEYDENIKEIEELEKELLTLKHENNEGLTDSDIINAEIKKSLLNKRKKLRNELRILTNRLNDIKFDQEYDSEKLSREFNKLKEFFPELDTSQMEKYETFHKNVKKILASELREDNSSTEEMIKILESEIVDLDNKLKEYKSYPDVSDAILERHTEIVSKIKQLKEANTNFDIWKKTSKEAKEASANLENAVNTIVNRLQSTINDKMNNINDTIDTNVYAPELFINSLKSYSFSTPEDTGTGTRFKGLIIFDLAVLQTTNLPVLVHDSIMFNNIESSTLKKILEIYSAQTSKQIFIAFDHYNTQEQELIPILTQHQVLLLSDEPNCLFGKQWNKKKV